MKAGGTVQGEDGFETSKEGAVQHQQPSNKPITVKTSRATMQSSHIMSHVRRLQDQQVRQQQRPLPSPQSGAWSCVATDPQHTTLVRCMCTLAHNSHQCTVARVIAARKSMHLASATRSRAACHCHKNIQAMCMFRCARVAGKAKHLPSITIMILHSQHPTSREHKQLHTAGFQSAFSYPRLLKLSPSRKPSPIHNTSDTPSNLH